MHDHPHHIEPLESPKEYIKFAAVILGIILSSAFFASASEWSTEVSMSVFMGIFFIVFAAFKFINIEMFAVAYRGYDIIAKRFPAWGYIFPFVELFLGFSYLLSDGPTWLNLLAIIITGTGSYSVYKELTRTHRRRGIMCACLGTVIRLPLSKVSLVENGLMLIMALAMLFL